MAHPNITLANAHEYIGQEIGLSEWLDIDQMQVNIFGEVTRWPTWLGRHDVLDRRKTLRMAHGDIHKTKGNHANLTAVRVGVRINHQINRTPFSD